MATKSIAFDLDDTLLDTSGLLVPRASKIAFDILISNGLQLSPAECEAYRLEMIKTISHQELFLHLAKKFGNALTLAAVPEAVQAFYEPNIPMGLPLVSGAVQVLDYLHNKYNLYVVTAGFESGQKKKIHSLQIEKYFKTIFVVNSLNNERKITAFRKILEMDRIAPQDLLCIGNSLSSEIKDANELGAISCYFEFGENRGAIPAETHLKPKFHIKNLSELIAVCEL